MTPTAHTYVQALHMQADPEGGFYRESYRRPPHRQTIHELTR